MKSRKMTIIRNISLLILCATALVIVGATLVGFELADTVVSVLGIVDLIALPICVFTSVKMLDKSGDTNN